MLGQNLNTLLCSLKLCVIQLLLFSPVSTSCIVPSLCHPSHWYLWSPPTHFHMAATLLSSPQVHILIFLTSLLRLYTLDRHSRPPSLRPQTISHSIAHCFFFNEKFLLESSCFTMFWNEVNQLYVYISPPSWTSLPTPILPPLGLSWVL